MTKKYVLTGGPGVGKTTITNELWDKGHYTIGEVATFIIQTEEKKENGKLPWTDRDGFQKIVLKTQKDWEKGIPKNLEDAFMDRGVIDGIAFYRIDGLQVPGELKTAAENSDYDKVFLLEPLEEYEQTNIRKEDAEEARKIHKEIEKAYKDYGYEPVKVPAVSLKERINKILKEIN